jgi:hypothetical protein
MALISLKTNLKSLKFGNDQPGGGSSNQPYIQTDIPNQSSPLNGGADSDFLLRGGITAPLNAAKDVLRLSKFFADTKSPNGLFFTLKQNLLSRTSVWTQASTGPSYGGPLGGVNQGIYTPLSTLAQAGVGFTGTHLNLLGLDPSSPMSGVVTDGLIPRLGLNRYGEVITYKQDPKDNRLVQFYKDKIIKSSDTLLSSHGGGPGSVLGIGKTNIYLSDQRTGINNINYPKDAIKTGFWYGNLNYYTARVANDRKLPLGVSRKYFETTKIPFFQVPEPKISFKRNGITGETEMIVEDSSALPWSNLVTSDSTFSYQNPDNISVYKEDSLDSNTTKISENDTKVLTQQQISVIGDELNNKNKIGTPSIIDFRRRLSNNTDFIAPEYSGPEAKNIENRVYLGDPGIKGYVGSYESGKQDVNGKPLGPLDKINASKLNKDRAKIIYDSDGAEIEGKSNDLVKFRIASLDSGGGDERIYMHFRALLDSFQDSYTADWQPQKYLGRGENFYSYNGFDRKISLSWTVYAQSKEELIPMYKKLNYLASNLAPDYSTNGYMRGPLISLTLGGYLYEQPGFITSLTYDIPNESTWEIGINDIGNFDPKVKELSHMIRVTSFNFTPLHYFVPRKANPNSLGSTPFIALTTEERGPGNYA